MKEIIYELPDDGSNVMIRLAGFEGVKVEALYSDAEQTFEIIQSGLIAPACFISSWEDITS